MIKDLKYPLQLPENEIKYVLVRCNFQCASEIYAKYKNLIEWDRKPRGRNEFLFCINISRNNFYSFANVLLNYSCIILTILYGSSDAFRLVHCNRGEFDV